MRLQLNFWNCVRTLNWHRHLRELIRPNPKNGIDLPLHMNRMLLLKSIVSKLNEWPSWRKKPVKFIEKLKNDRCSPFSENFSENLFSENDAYPMQTVLVFFMRLRNGKLTVNLCKIEVGCVQATHLCTVTLWKWSTEWMPVDVCPWNGWFLQEVQSQLFFCHWTIDHGAT